MKYILKLFNSANFKGICEVYLKKNWMIFGSIFVMVFNNFLIV